MIKLTDLLIEQDDEIDFNLPRGEKVILKAEGYDYDRGLIIELTEEGGYDVWYWVDEPSNITSSEIRVDGEEITDNGKKVFLGFHPKEEITESVWVSSKERWPHRNQKVKIKTDLGNIYTGYYNWDEPGWFTERGKELLGVRKWKPV